MKPVYGLVEESSYKFFRINLSNFNRRFLQFKQVSPKAYRQQYLESAERSGR